METIASKPKRPKKAKPPVAQFRIIAVGDVMSHDTVLPEPKVEKHLRWLKKMHFELWQRHTMGQLRPMSVEIINLQNN